MKYIPCNKGRDGTFLGIPYSIFHIPFPPSPRGFLLIELLVVLSIVSLLSSIILASVSTARMKARDARRISDSRQIQTALAIYRDNRGYYPNCAGIIGRTEYIVNGTTECLSAALIGDGLINMVPSDPKWKTVNGAWGYDYQYYWTPGGTDFAFRMPLETDIRKQTHAYPGGATCQPDPNPVCDWYGNCVYKGYNPSGCVGYSLGIGSK